MSLPVVSQSDRKVLLALQGFVVGLPLFLGGRQPWAVAAGSAVILLLLAVTIRERRRRGAAPYPPGIAALVGLVGLALATTLPLPPTVLRLLAPATARLYTEMLPGWPGNAGWTVWRPLAIDPYGVWAELSRFSIGLGAFLVTVAYPWRATAEEEDARAAVFDRLLLTLLAGGALLAGLGLLSEATGSGRVLWITGVPAWAGRVSGPFVNPNHFAAWLGMVIPATLSYAVAMIGLVSGRLREAVDEARAKGMRPRQAWVAALIAHQRRLWAPLLTCTVLLLMGVAHAGSGSRGGMAALLLGLSVASAGIARSMRSGNAPRRATSWGLAALALGAASGASVALWLAAEGTPSLAVESIDVSLPSRLAVSAEGSAIVRDHPLFGTGLGSWLHAFRPYQAPPVEGGIWDHAHNDYLELAAENGIAGVALVMLFALAVLRASRREQPIRAVQVRLGPHEPPSEDLHSFELPEWRAALREHPFIRCGLAGGVAAALAQSLVDFGLHMPANFLALMVVVALLVLSGRSQRAGGTGALGLLLVLLVAAAGPQVANSARLLAGAAPVSSRDCLEKADLVLAEDGDRGRALALVRRGLDRSPASLEGHEALAAALEPGPAAEAELRRALALSPWSPEVRDRLALQLWARGARQEGAAELEESMSRFPSLTSHAYLGAGEELEPGRHAGEVVRAEDEGDGDGLNARLAALEDEMAEAIGRGLNRALESSAGEERTRIVEDLVTLLEARAHWRDAATALQAEAERNARSVGPLVRAARDYLKADDGAAAERVLRAALQRAPERGDLYRTLAVDVYAARGDFPAAESVLHAGERNALDMLPVYEGVTEVLGRRESMAMEKLVSAAPPPSAPDDQEVVP